MRLVQTEALRMLWNETGLKWNAIWSLRAFLGYLLWNVLRWKTWIEGNTRRVRTITMVAGREVRLKGFLSFHAGSLVDDKDYCSHSNLQHTQSFAVEKGRENCSSRALVVVNQHTLLKMEIMHGAVFMTEAQAHIDISWLRKVRLRTTSSADYPLRARHDFW